MHIYWYLLLVVIFVIYSIYNNLTLGDIILNFLDVADILPIPDLIKKILFHIRIKYFGNNRKLISKNNFKKRNVTNLQKKIIASKQQWRCKKCQKILDYTYEIDHIIPLFKGGCNDNYNLQALCRNCHGKKSLEDKYNI